MTGYTKLFGSILESTVWLEPPPIKVVWITLLAMADRDGVVEASVPGLAKRAGVERGDCERALAVFLSPDTDSRTKDFEGRRIEVVPGGWRLLNYETYRERASAEESKEKAAARQRRKRLRDKSRASQNITPVTRSHDIAEADPPAKAPSEEHTKSARAREEVSLVPDKNAVDDGERASWFLERYAELYPEHRNGARFLPKPALDWPTACELVRVWPSDRLEKLAIVFLKTDHEFASNGSRTIRQFAAMASWCDDRLRQVEIERGR